MSAQDANFDVGRCKIYLWNFQIKATEQLLLRVTVRCATKGGFNAYITGMKLYYNPTAKQYSYRGLILDAWNPSW